MTTRPAPAWHTIVHRGRAGTGDRAVAVEVRLSSRRRTCSAAHWDGDQIVVVLPERLPVSGRGAVVEELVERLLTRRPSAVRSDAELAERASRLADRYVDGVRAESVRWATNQRRRWGSCSPSSRDIRISDRLRQVPDWVLDAVLVHELAHLLVARHGPSFRAIVERYPRLAEADTFLAGYSLGLGLASSHPAALADQ